MFLLFDVGNTNIFIGVSDGFKIIDTYRLNTEITKTSDEYYIQMKNIIDFTIVKHVAISSVVPRITEKLKEISKKYIGLDPLVVGPGVKTGLNIKTDHPREVGADLICDAVGLDEDIDNALIVDLGTAIKYIYVKNKTILGVIITPGVSVSIKALVGHTALLPDIDIEVPKKVLGTNTIHCMQSGVTYGVAAQVDGLIDMVKKEVNEDFKVILTGGLSTLIAPLCSHDLTVDVDIILKGLLKIYNKNEQFRK
ncbi:MAG: type III pantothenate kinase [Acholeplasmataceae bacterium]|nr:type III pantothenate kinase [Acholeplasmataceae bacterium]